MTNINKTGFWDCSTDLKTWIQVYLRWYISSDQEGIMHMYRYICMCLSKKETSCDTAENKTKQNKLTKPPRG